MLAEQLGLLLLRSMIAPALALFPDLSHSNRHLRRTQGEDRHRVQDRFARIRHELTPCLIFRKIALKSQRLCHDATGG
jgi:hypothetical protein